MLSPIQTVERGLVGTLATGWQQLVQQEFAMFAHLHPLADTVDQIEKERSSISELQFILTECWKCWIISVLYLSSPTGEPVLRSRRAQVRAGAILLRHELALHRQGSACHSHQLLCTNLKKCHLEMRKC